MWLSNTESSLARSIVVPMRIVPLPAMQAGENSACKSIESPGAIGDDTLGAVGN